MEASNFEISLARPPAEALVPQSETPEAPEVQEAERPSEIQGAPAVSGPDSRITVVICDDHPAYAQGLALLLEHEAPGFKVVGVATDATRAVAMAAVHYPAVVLMDIRMPTIDGIEATGQIKAIAPETKVVMLTVSDEAGDLYEAMRAGASGFVTKDKEVAEIAQAIQQVLLGHLVIPSDLSARFLTDVTNADITSTLTEIETVLLTGFTQGKTNKQIAQALGKSERTVCRRIDDLYRKLNITDRIQAAIWATQQGFGTLNPNGIKKRPGRPLKVRNKPGRPLGSNGAKKSARPLKVQAQNRPPESLAPTQVPTTEGTAS